MGLKNHLEDGTGHILSLGLDLDYLHVDGAERQDGLSIETGPENIVGVLQVRAGAPSNSSSGSSSTSCSTHSSYSSSSSCSNFSEESAVSDSEDERLQNGSGSVSHIPQQDQPHLQHQEPVRLDVATNQSPPPPKSPPLTDPVTDCRTKVEFALKLGYSEELVLLVLKKLGANALINDILGELVKLGTKAETDQQGGQTVSQSSTTSLVYSSSSSSNSSLDSCRLLYSSQLLEDKENLRPVVVDGSNVAMRWGRVAFETWCTFMYLLFKHTCSK